MMVQAELPGAFQYSKLGVRLEIQHTQDIDEWIAQRHYLASAPPGARVRMAFVTAEHTLLGAMMWCRPAARHYDQLHILELARMCFADDLPANGECHCLALARKYIRKQMPEVKGLLAYASVDKGLEGMAYAADGWFRMGISRTSASWETREGRADRDRGDKARWVRSP